MLDPSSRCTIQSTRYPTVGLRPHEFQCTPTTVSDSRCGYLVFNFGPRFFERAGFDDGAPNHGVYGPNARLNEACGTRLTFCEVFTPLFFLATCNRRVEHCTLFFQPVRPEHVWHVCIHTIGGFMLSRTCAIVDDTPASNCADTTFRKYSMCSGFNKITNPLIGLLNSTITVMLSTVDARGATNETVGENANTSARIPRVYRRADSI